MLGALRSPSYLVEYYDSMLVRFIFCSQGVGSDQVGGLRSPSYSVEYDDVCFLVLLAVHGVWL